MFEEYLFLEMLLTSQHLLYDVKRDVHFVKLAKDFFNDDVILLSSALEGSWTGLKTVHLQP
jgi:hypothetical protein